MRITVVTMPAAMTLSTPASQYPDRATSGTKCTRG